VLLRATRASGFARADRAARPDLIMPVCGREAPQPVCSGDRPAAPLAPSRGVRYRPRFLACCCRSLTSCALARSHADAVAPARVHTRRMQAPPLSQSQQLQQQLGGRHPSVPSPSTGHSVRASELSFDRSRFSTPRGSARGASSLKMREAVHGSAQGAARGLGGGGVPRLGTGSMQASPRTEQRRQREDARDATAPDLANDSGDEEAPAPEYTQYPASRYEEADAWGADRVRFGAMSGARRRAGHDSPRALPARGAAQSQAIKSKISRSRRHQPSRFARDSDSDSDLVRACSLCM
jgi:hypothetical protein